MYYLYHSTTCKNSDFLLPFYSERFDLEEEKLISGQSSQLSSSINVDPFPSSLYDSTCWVTPIHIIGEFNQSFLEVALIS